MRRWLIELVATGLVSWVMSHIAPSYSLYGILVGLLFLTWEGLREIAHTNCGKLIFPAITKKVGIPMSYLLASLLGGVFGVTYWKIIQNIPLLTTSPVSVPKPLTSTERDKATEVPETKSDPKSKEKVLTSSLQSVSKESHKVDGPEPYKDFTNNQLVDWTLELAAKLKVIYKRTGDDMIAGIRSKGAIAFQMTNEVSPYLIDIEQLHDEMLKRLTPAAKDNIGEAHLITLRLQVREWKNIANPMIIDGVATYLQQLASNLKNNPANEMSRSTISPEKASIKKNAPKSVIVESARVSHVRIASQRRVNSERGDLPYALEVVVQTDQTIQPVSFLFKCSGEVGYVTGMTGTVTMQIRPVQGKVIGHPDWFVMQWDSPPFTSSQNMNVLILSKEPVTVIELKSIAPDSLPVKVNF